MGLDIYLYAAAEREQNERHDAEWNALYQSKVSGEFTEAEYDELRKDTTPYVTVDAVPSERHPDHLCNRRYLRSSYNSGGFNQAVSGFLGEDHGLYWVFEPMGREWDGDEGTLTGADVPKLVECRKRAEQVAEELRAADPLQVEEIGNFLVKPTMRKAEFLAWYRGEKAKHAVGKASFDSYQTRDGTVMGFEKGLDVLAVTVGVGTFGEPSALIVYRSEALDSYVQTAEITAEFCDEAIGLIERDGSAHISWSG